MHEPKGEVHFRKLGLDAQLAHTLDSPWVAYFLFVAGLALIVFEFFSVGVGVAGFVGAVALIGGAFGFSHLPVVWWAVGLLLLGMFGMSIDVQARNLGPWTFIGAGSLVAGSIWLFGGSARLDPTWWVLVLVIGSTVVFMLSGMTAMVRSRFSTPTIGREDLVGEMGLAEADVDPDGVVRIRDALWRALDEPGHPHPRGRPGARRLDRGCRVGGRARDRRRPRSPRAPAPVLTWPFVWPPGRRYLPRVSRVAGME